MTGSGGWPMSVFLAPDRRPFFGGTYFPPEGRHGGPSFRTVLTALTDVWDNRRDEVEEQAGELAEAIGSRSVLATGPGDHSTLGALRGGDDGPDLVEAAVADLARRFDATWGGFGPAPKFPQPTSVELCLRRAGRHPDDHQALRMATTTLDAMAAGGIHDHLAGGFARYATDPEWLVPHFEKMLYDQAGLLRAYLHGWQATGRPDYLRVVEGIVAYVTADLTDGEGGLYSAEDADSEGVEGRFYVWTPDQVSEAVGRGGSDPAGAVADALAGWFAITPAGNFEGSTILRRPVGAPLGGPADVELGRARLLEARSGRVRPGLDDKVLTEWNAMYASSLAEAAAATGRRDWAGRAIAIGEFLYTHLRRTADGRWLRSWQRQGGARHLAYAADHAWLVDAFTRLAELTGEARWTERACQAADTLLDLFHDDEGGGFFTTGHDAEALIVRTKDVLDGATPSANATAALALARLGALTGDDRYTGAAREVVAMVGTLLSRHPAAFAHTVLAADLLRRGATEVVITGDRPDLVETVQRRWLPDAVLAWGEPTGSPLWEGRSGDLAYVCREYACQTPAADPATLVDQLGPTPR
jgi:uncharacterized protein YyaL (SSP411 family)